MPIIEEEIVEKRTLYSKVFSTDNGGYYTIVSATPIHIEDENGDLQDIIENTDNYLCEENIEQFITQETETYLNMNSVSVFSTGVGEEDQYIYSHPCLIKCFGTSGEDSSGSYWVQGNKKGNKAVYIKPAITQSNILVTSAKISADALGVGTTINNYVVAKEIVSDWDSETSIKPGISSKYFDGLSVIKGTTTTACSCDSIGYFLILLLYARFTQAI